MAYKKAVNKFKKKAKRVGRWRSKAWKRGEPTSMIVKGPSFISDEMYTRLQFSETIALTSTVSATTRIYRGNSIFDPVNAVGGHSCLGHNQLDDLYRKYRVLGCKINVDFSASSGIANVFVLARNTATASATSTALIEKPYTSFGLLQSGGPAIRLSRYQSTQQILGLSKHEVSVDDSLSANMSANPTLEWFYIIGSQHPDGSTSQTVYGTVRLTYFVKLFDRITPIQSA